MFSCYNKFIQNFLNKILPLNHNDKFPLPLSALHSFQTLKNNSKDVTLVTVDPAKEFKEDIDATLNQEGRPVAFFTHTLNPNEIKHHAAEKEAAAIVEALRKCRYILLGRHFRVITDQKSISFIFYNTRKSKIRNDNIYHWFIELSQFKFSIVYHPGTEKTVVNTFSRISTLTHTLQDLRNVHLQLCHPRVIRLFYITSARNLPFSLDQIRSVTNSRTSCQYLKPKFITSGAGTLIKAILPFPRLNIDFKKSLPSSIHGNKYLLTAINEFSRFPFAFPC